MQFLPFTVALFVLLTPVFSYAFVSSEVLEVENARRLSDKGERVVQLRRLSESGNSYAILELGVHYLSGGGVAKDEAEAKRLFQKAADRGNPYAMNALGNFPEALKVLSRESERGDGHATYGLAMMYSRGKGVPRNDAEATRLLQKASDQGSMDASYLLGHQYSDTNPHEAIRLFRKAAALGNSNAAVRANELEAKIRK